jgi:glycosyltransferase involved in cell wall biosynthesis
VTLAAHRLLIVNHAVEMGGAERVLVRLLDRLDRELFEPALACPVEGPLTEEMAARGIRVHLGYPAPRLLGIKRRSLGRNRLTVAAYPYDMAHTVVGLARLIAGEGYDLVFTNSAKADIYGSIAGRLAARPVVWRLHDIVAPDAFNRLNIMLFRICASLFATRVLAVSEAVRVALVARGVKENKVRVVYNGIDMEKDGISADRGAMREEWGIPAGAPLAGMVGRLVDWKGPDRFIEAASLVAGEMPQARFMLVGDAIFGEASYVDGLKELTSGLGLDERVIFTGFREDVPDIMAALDLLVHSSIQPDPLPTVLIEAMALWVPVVAADGGGVREIVENGVTGLVVPPAKVDEMARAMVRILSDPTEAKAMGEKGRERAAEIFNIEMTTRRMEDELLDALGETR